ncbi:MAG: cytoplasmic protein [Desulfobacterales bacterium]
MNDSVRTETIDFSVDKNNLYREESITDLKVASIRRLVPVKSDGSEDNERSPIFMGHTQLMSQQGPVPIQARLTSTELEGAIAEFPAAMQKALDDVVEKIQQLQREQQIQQMDKSRIIVPGR